MNAAARPPEGGALSRGTVEQGHPARSLPIRIAVAAAFALVVAAAVFAVASNERTLRTGRVVLAELAPVDPRSLMQGDYMALRFAIDDALPRRTDEGAPPAYAHLAVDAEGRASFAATSDVTAAGGERVAMRIRARDGRYSIGPNAFFFQEGKGAAFEQARWGEFRVAPDGKALLTHLRDEHLQRLGENRR